MTESRSTGPGRLQAACVLASLGLVSLLSCQTAINIFASPDQVVLLVLAPLLVAAFRYPVLGRILGWVGLLAQITAWLAVR